MLVNNARRVDCLPIVSGDIELLPQPPGSHRAAVAPQVRVLGIAIMSVLSGESVQRVF